MNSRFLSGKEKRDIFSKMKDQYDIDIVPNVELVESGKGKVWMVTKNINKIDTLKLNIERYGVYAIFIDKYGVRFTIEGTQIFGQFAKKNIFEIKKEDVQKWIRGFDLDIETGTNGYVMVKCGEDYLGCGKGSHGRIQNYIPKSRRILRLREDAIENI